MKHLSVLLFVLLISMASCTIQKEEIVEKTVKENEAYSFQPKPLDDEWSNWLVGKWKVISGHTDFIEGEAESVEESNEEVAAGFTIEPCLNGQFLIWKSWNEIGEMTAEEKKELKEALKKTTKVSDDELERFVNMPYKSVLIQTICPKTGERIAYCFDSQRLYGQGTGRLEANKEIMEWKWSGIGRGVTSIGIIEKINDNKFSVGHKYTLPDGNTMEEKLDIARTE